MVLIIIQVTLKKGLSMKSYEIRLCIALFAVLFCKLNRFRKSDHLFHKSLFCLSFDMPLPKCKNISYSTKYLV